MVNATQASTGQPAQSTIPDTSIGFVHNTTQYAYASPSGTVNNVVGGFPSFVGNVRLTVTLAAGNATWTGLQAGIDGQHVFLWNNDAANSLTLSIKDSGSLAVNQFNGATGTVLGPGNACLLVYYAGTVNAWVISYVATAGTSGGKQLVSSTITAASTNNANPGGGFPTLIGYWNINPTTNNITLTGLLAGSSLQQLVIRNIGTTYTITLSTGGNGQGDSNSLAANRFVGQGDVAIPPGGQSTIVYYTSPSSQWGIG